MTDHRRPTTLRPIGRPLGRGLDNGGWSSFSPARKRRLLRTGAIALVLLVIFVWLISRCGGGDEVVAVPASSTTAPTTEVPRAQLANATLLQVSLAKPAYEGVAAVIDNKVYVLGGLNEKKQSTSTIWSFDPATNTVTEAGALTTATHDAMGGSLGGAAFAFGGAAGNKTFDKAEAFIPGSPEATATSKLPGPRSDGVAVGNEANDSLFLIGGTDGKNPTNDVLGTSDGTLFAARAMLAEPVTYPAAVMDGNVIWVFGGEQNNQPTDLVQKIDLATGQVTVAGRLPKPLSHASAFMLGNSIFVAGGKSGDGLTDAIRRFDPETVTAVDAGVLPAKSSDSMVVRMGETVYLLGGLNPKPTSDIVAITAS